MTDEQKAAYAISMAAQAMIETIAMQAANRQANPENTPPYLEGDFKALIEKHGIHHNALMTLFHG